MGKFDGLTNQSFKEDSEGRTVFFPWGVFGAGYLAEDSETVERLRRQMKILWAVGFCIFSGVYFWHLVTGDYLVAVVVVVLFAVFSSYWTKRATSGLKKSNEQLGVGESIHRSAMSESVFTHVFLALMSAGFVAWGVWALFYDDNLGLALVLIGAMGPCTALFVYMAIVRTRSS